MTPPPDPNLHLLDSLPLLIWSAGRDARCNYFNRAWLEFTGRSLEEELGDGWTDGVHRGDLNECLKSYLTAFRAREPFEMEYRLLRHDGSYRWVSVEARPIFDGSDEFHGFIGYGFDATDGKLGDESLKSDERSLRMLAELSPVAIFHMDTEMNFQFANDFWERFTGFSLETSSGLGWLEAVHADDRPRIEMELDDRIRNQEKFNFECRIVNTAGDENWVLFQGRPELDDERALRGYIGTITDLTDRKQLADKELRLTTIESLGGLAGQIAHEFNNLLTPIVLNLNMAQNQLHQPGLLQDLKKRLAEAEEAAQRAKSLTQRLLSFGKIGNPMKRTADLKQLVEETLRFPLQGGSVRAELDFPEDLWSAELDTNQFHQAILNLMVNAAEATLADGAVRLSASNVESVDVPGLPRIPGRHVRVRIEDEGAGIDPEHLDRIFDPYFSTKNSHSGLGLAIVHTIVHKHGGHLHVESTPNEGTAFSIYLPASAAKAAGKTGARKKAKKKTADGARILIMDDEELIRSSVRAILQTLGYEVETARDGTEALDIYVQAKEDGKPIDLTLMDLTIQGGMGGKEAIAELTALDPDALAVVCSGHSNDPVMVNFSEYGFRGAIRKPFHPDDLDDLLGDLLCA